MNSLPTIAASLRDAGAMAERATRSGRDRSTADVGFNPRTRGVGLNLGPMQA